MDIKLSPSKIFKFLLTMYCGFLVLHLIGLGIKYFGDFPEIEEHLVRLVDFDVEQNFPSTFSSFLLFSASVILFYISKAGVKNQGKFWLGLSIIFLYLSLDEFISLHEILMGPARYLLELDGIFYYTWVVPYGILFIIFAAAYMKFTFSLPARIRNIFIAAGIIFVGGALGFEMIGSGYIVSVDHQANLTYRLITTLEESLEMIGISYFIYGLLLYIQQEISHTEVKMTMEEKEQTQESVAFTDYLSARFLNRN